MRKLLIKYKKFVGGRNFFHDVLYTIIGQSLVMILALILNKCISYYFVPSEYAIFSIANKAAQLFAMIMLFGLGIALPYYIARLRVRDQKVAETSILFTSTMMLFFSIFIVFLIAIYFKSYLSLLLFGNTFNQNLIIPTLFFAVSISTSNYVYAYLRSVDSFRTFNLIQIAAQFISLVVVLTSGANLVLHLLARGVLIAVLSVIVIIYIAKKYYKLSGINYILVKKYRKELFLYCSPRIPGEIILFAYTLAPLVIINNKFGVNNTAGFATALVICTSIMPLFGFIGMALFPYVSKQLELGNLNGINEKIKKLSLLCLLISVLSVIVVYSFTGTVINILFNSEYLQFVSTVRIVSLAVIPYSLYILLRNPIDAISRKPYNTINLIISFGFLMILLVNTNSLFISGLAFPLSFTFLGILSLLTWQLTFKKYNKNSCKA